MLMPEGIATKTEVFNNFSAKHGKVYNGIGENDKRFEIFKENLRVIDKHNF